MLNLFASHRQNLKADILSGVTVSLALVPEAVAFAFVAGVSPVVGLYSAFFIGLITAICGGRPGMISGATGAMAVIVVSLVAMHGVEYLFPAVILCGLIQILVGVGRLGMLIRMVPHSVLLGFVNGLAIVIFMAQLGTGLAHLNSFVFGSFSHSWLRVRLHDGKCIVQKRPNLSAPTLQLGSFQIVSGLGELTYIQGPALWIMLGLIATTMAIIWLLPRLTRAVPASLAAILVVTAIAAGLNGSLDSRLAAENQQRVVLTVGDMLLSNEKAKVAAALRSDFASEGGETSQGDGLASRPADTEAIVRATLGGLTADSVTLSAGLPRPFFLDYAFPPLALATLWIILPYSLVLASVGLIESLMTLSLVDEITETRGQGNRECIGQGIANAACGLFGGMGGCAMIGQSLINVNSGGRGRLSGIVAAVCLLMFVLFLAPWIEMIPMAALVGVMFMVVIGTFEWASLRMFGKIPKGDYLSWCLSPDTPRSCTTWRRRS